MSKYKVDFKHRITHCFIYHPWLKLIALILAIIVWFYAREEMNQFKY